MTDQYYFGLVGHNVGYSRSPQIFEAVFDHLGTAGRFEMFDVAPKDLTTRIQQLAISDIQGVSVTIPYKNQIIPYLNDLDPVAKALQAVNSVRFEDGRSCGFNTDGYGFSLPLARHSGALKNGTALVLGNGGSARAAIYALYTDYEIGGCTVVGRDSERLRTFKRSLAGPAPQLEINTRRYGAGRSAMATPWNIVVNCTPLGGWNHPDESPLPAWLNWSAVRIYYDLNYNENNRLIAAARQAGATAIDGSAMLVGQALRSLHIWTGQTVQFEPVYERVFGG
jgi:shikimate dehydrogenase